MSEEIWRDIYEYEGKYQASSLGRIKSLERIYIGGNNCKRLLKEKIMKFQNNCDGYPMVQLCRNGDTKTISVHRVVALTFLENINNYDTVNHKNGIKTDNSVENLEWALKIDNYRHAQDTGLIPYKINNEDILKIKELYATGKYPQHKLASLYNVHQCFISRIVNGKRRKRAHLSKK